MRAVALWAGHAAEIIDIPNEMAAWQEFVGGDIEKIPFPGVPGVVILVDEEGKMKSDKRFNRPIRNRRGETLDWLFGDALVVRTNVEDFTDLTAVQAEVIARRCRMPHGAIYVEG